MGIFLLIICAIFGHRPTDIAGIPGTQDRTATCSRCHSTVRQYEGKGRWHLDLGESLG